MLHGAAGGSLSPDAHYALFSLPVTDPAQPGAAPAGTSRSSSAICARAPSARSAPVPAAPR
ncbi:hypothetical protein ACFQ0M_04005 [Kitasatospora aburaviensis]